VLLAATDQEQAQQGQPPLVSTQFTLENFESFGSPWNRGRLAGARNMTSRVHAGDGQDPVYRRVRVSAAHAVR
jgi:hypothetical protein